MSPCTRRVALGAAILAALGLGAVAAGLVPIAASSGHWPVTEWLLHFTMRRSVQTRALWVGEPPDLDDPALVLRGAGHYATGCAPCHGAPGAEPSGVTRQMTPVPPLVEQIDEWTPAQLFWIVRHGVKFTGMPAWPAVERDDEVWAMVAFLLRLPGLEPAQYRRLAFAEEDAAGQGSSDAGHRQGSHAGDHPLSSPDGLGSPGPGDAAVAGLTALPGPPEPETEACDRCHGEDGLGRVAGAFPRLAGQREAYLSATLAAYASGARRSGIMQPIASALSEERVRELARRFSQMPRGPAASPVPELKERGEQIARRGVPERKVAACVPCHGPGPGARNPYYPELAGQDPRYLAEQIQLFGSGKRGGTVWAEVMEISSHRLRQDEADAVAAWYASLAPGSDLTSGRFQSGRGQPTR